MEGDKLKKVFWSSIPLSLLVVSTLSAAPVGCTDAPTGVLATVAAPGVIPTPSTTTVTCGPVTFSMFQAQDASGGSTTGLNVSEAGSSFDPATGQAVLGFNPGFVSNAAQDIHLLFKVTSTTPLSAADLRVGGTGAAITERLCTGATDLSSGLCLGSTQLAVLTANSGGTQTIAFTSGVGGSATTTTSLFGYKDIGKVAGTATAPTELTSVGQSFQTTAGVPEPATFAMLGGGLLLFALARRKKA